MEKYWPWFWMICPVYVLVLVLSFLLALVFDFKAFIKDARELRSVSRQPPIKSKEGFFIIPIRYISPDKGTYSQSLTLIFTETAKIKQTYRKEVTLSDMSVFLFNF